MPKGSVDDGGVRGAAGEHALQRAVAAALLLHDALQLEGRARRHAERAAAPARRRRRRRGPTSCRRRRGRTASRRRGWRGTAPSPEVRLLGRHDVDVAVEDERSPDRVHARRRAPRRDDVALALDVPGEGRVRGGRAARRRRAGRRSARAPRRRTPPPSRPARAPPGRAPWAAPRAAPAGPRWRQPPARRRRRRSAPALAAVRLPPQPPPRASAASTASAVAPSPILRVDVRAPRSQDEPDDHADGGRTPSMHRRQDDRQVIERARP